MICFGDTKNSGASREVPVESFTLTLAPSSVVGSGMVDGVSVPAARPPLAKALAIDPAAKAAPAWKPAPLTWLTAGAVTVVLSMVTNAPLTTALGL